MLCVKKIKNVDNKKNKITESQENVGHAARQQPQAHKSFYQRMVKEEQS